MTPRRLTYRPDSLARLLEVPDFHPHLARGKSGATVLRATIVDEVRLEERTPISDQGEAGSCVANATMDAIETIMPVVVQLSRRFSYWTARRADGGGAEDRDDGTFIRSALEQARELGVCREETFPYDDRDIISRPPLGSYLEALDHRIEEFYAIRGQGKLRLDRVAAALDAGLPVIVGMSVGKAWFDVDARDVAHGPPANTVGGHAQVVVGYRTLADGSRWWRIRNSWGTGWGASGYAWVTDAYLGDLLWCDELFVAVRAPTGLEAA